MICPNCSIQLDEDAKFCHSCGTKLSDNTRNQRRGKQVIKSAYQPRKELRAGNRKSRHLLLPAAGFVLTAVILTLFLLPFTKKASEGFVYLKEGEFYYKDMKSGKPIELTEDFYDAGRIDRYFEFRMNFMVKFNQNRNRIFFPGDISDPEGDIDLYSLDLKNKGAKPERIAEGIWIYAINDAGTSVYYTNSENELYESNLSDEKRIASEVSYFVASEDGSRLIWFDKEDNMYYKNGDGDKVKIDRINGFVDWTPDLKKIYYLKRNEVYLSVDGEKGEKILSGVSSVLKVYKTGEIYYTHQVQEEKKLSEFVEDDMLEADKIVTEPKQPKYPSYEDCRPVVPVPEEPDWKQYTDRNGDTDWDSYQSDYNSYTEKIKNYNTDWDGLYREALERYDRENDVYDTAELNYSKKKERDSLRKELEQEMVTITHSTLYYYDTKESTAVSDLYKDCTTISEEHPAIVYDELKLDNIDKMKLSEITAIDEVSSRVSSTDPSSLDHFAAVGAIRSKLESEQDGYYVFDPELKFLYYANHYVDGKGYLEFYRVPIRDSGLGTPELYDEEVSFVQVLKGYDKVLYYKNDENALGDLYLEKSRIDRDVNYSWVIPSATGNGLYYISDYDRDTSSGTLMFYNGKETEEISENVHDFHVLDDKNVIYLKDYEPEKGTGKVYLNNGKEIKIDGEVSILLKYDKFFDYYQEDFLITPAAASDSSDR